MASAKRARADAPSGRQGEDATSGEQDSLAEDLADQAATASVEGRAERNLAAPGLARAASPRGAAAANGIVGTPGPAAVLG
jgi:hypothetical protein